MSDEPLVQPLTDPSVRQLREFAALWLLLFGGAGLWRAATEGLTPWALAALAAAPWGAAGLVKPGILRPVFVGWMWLAWPLSWLVQNMALAAMFFLVFVPVGLGQRLFRRDALLLRRQDAGASLWVPVPPRDDPQSYTRQS